MKTRRMSALALALSAATCLTPVSFAQAAPGDPVGSEFRVNSATIGDQGASAVAMDADGDFVVTWTGQDGNGYGVFAQRYDTAGVAQGGEFRVNSFTTNDQRAQAVAMDADGDFVVTWMSYYQDGSYVGVYAQRYNAAGIPQGGEFRVSSSPSAGQIIGLPAVAMDADGDFVVAWARYLSYSDLDVYARRFNASGVAQANEFRVNNTASHRQSFPAVAMDADGDFVVTWDSYGQTGGLGYYDIFARRYNAAGTAQGNEFRVNNTTDDEQGVSAVAMDADGDFVVAWQSYGQDGSGYGIYARRYNAAGTAQGNEFPVNTEVFDWQTAASVALDADGNFVVAWDSYGQDGSQFGVYAQRYDAAGAAQGGEFRVNTTTVNSQSLPGVAMDADGDFVVAWQSYGQDESGYGVYAQRYQGAGSAASDFDADAMSDILWRNTVTGGAVIWLMNGFDKDDSGPIGGAGTDWQVMGSGDFNGDRKADVLWRNTVTGGTVIWQMNGLVKDDSGSIGAPSTDWQVAGTGDFNGDRKADILWRNSTTGSALVWLMNGLAKGDSGPIGNPGAGWQVAGVGDFNKDTKADILWRNSTTGAPVVWQMNGFVKEASGSIGNPGADWQVERLGDFNGDRRSDILWRNGTTANPVVWLMNGFVKEAAGSIGNPGADWQIQGAGDHDGDGMSDILWRNTGTGNAVIWKMNGLSKDSAGSIGSPSTVWEIQ